MKNWIILITVAFLAACSQDGNAAFIRGIWQGTDEGSAGSNQDFIQWQFSRGSFVLQQEIREGELMVSEGSYYVVDSSGDELIVEFYNITGDVFTYNNLPATYIIEIDRATGNIRINSRVFERIK